MIHNSCEIQYLTKFFTFNLGFMKTMAFYLWPQGKENVEGIALLLAQLHCVSHCYKYIYRKGKKLQSKQWLFMTSTKTLVSISCNHCWNSFYGLLLNHLSNFFFFFTFWCCTVETVCLDMSECQVPLWFSSLIYCVFSTSTLFSPQGFSCVCPCSLTQKAYLQMWSYITNA